MSHPDGQRERGLGEHRVAYPVGRRGERLAAVQLLGAREIEVELVARSLSTTGVKRRSTAPISPLLRAQASHGTGTTVAPGQRRTARAMGIAECTP